MNFNIQISILQPVTFDQLLRSLFSFSNPIYISIIIVIAIFGIIVIIYKSLINPVIERNRLERENLELKSAKLMALFAELDPDPVIRIDEKGIIIETNKAAENVFKTKKLKGVSVQEILPQISFDVQTAIKSNRIEVITLQIENRFFSVLFRSEQNLNIAQIYLRDITELKTYEAKLIESQTKIKDLSDHLQDLIEEEKTQIARGLHDGVGQNLSLLRIQLIKYNETIQDTDTAQKYNEIINTLEGTINELKEISFSLRPKLLEELGLGIALKHLVDKVSKESGILGEVNVIGPENRLNNKLEIYLYRITQEAVNNILKYSCATNFSIQLIADLHFVRLIISDNGNGFDTEKFFSAKSSLHGMGLINIRERSKSFNGNFKIDSSPGSGTVLIVEIPLTNENLWKIQDQYVY